MGKSFTRKIAGIFVLITILAGCSTSRFVPENQYLLNQNIIKIDHRTIKPEQLSIYIQQKPNKRIFQLVRIHLHLYNLLCNESDRGPLNWIGKTMGEPPVIYDRFLTQKTITQLKTYLANRGYYNAEVKDSLVYGNRSVTVYYVVRTSEPYRIESFQYNFADPRLESLILPDTLNSPLRKGEVFDIELFEKERQRITRKLRENGFYFFTANYINYIADTTLSPNRVSITSNIGFPPPGSTVQESIVNVNNTCYIRNIYIFPNFDPKRAIVEGASYLNSFDTIVYKNFYFLYHNNMPINPDLVLKTLSIKQGDRYDIRKVEETNRFLNSIGYFKLSNIRFQDFAPIGDTAYFIDCQIQLTPYVIQSYSLEAEVANSGKTYELAGNISYQHRNIFKGAETFNTKIKAAAQIVNEAVTETDSKNFRFNSYEYGADVSIDFPKFFIPISLDQFYKRYHPKTTTHVSYNYQNHPNYTRTIINGNFGYFWQGSPTIRHTVIPIELNSVRFPTIDPEYLQANAFRIKDFDNFFISSSWLGIVFNNQQQRKNRDYHYIRFTIEAAGNVATAIMKASGATKIDGSYTIDPQTKIAQFLKTDIDLRYYQVLDKRNRIVYRTFVGIGVPYGNINNMPFVKQYSAGGSGDVRAWQIGRLGPGTYRDTTLYPTQTSNLKIIGNIEYRFPIFWKLEGALFADVGNIWAIGTNEMRPEAKFNYQTFYKQFALGSGLGLRVDLSFLIVRLDTGLKLRDPSLTEKSGWIPLYRKFDKNDFQLHIGIGYPF